MPKTSNISPRCGNFAKSGHTDQEPNVKTNLRVSLICNAELDVPNNEAMLVLKLVAKCH